MPTAVERLWPRLQAAAARELEGKRWQVLGPKRRKRLQELLRDYTPEQLVAAVAGYREKTAGLPHQNRYFAFENIFKLDTIEANIDWGLEVLEKRRSRAAGRLQELPEELRPPDPQAILESGISGDPTQAWREALRLRFEEAKAAGDLPTARHCKAAWRIVEELGEG